MKDFYRILGVPDNATLGDIKSAYRRLAKQYHPDLNPGSRHSEEKFKEILDAYTILSDVELRAQYDRKRRMGSSSEFFSTPKPGPEKKKDPGKKEYPPEYIEMMRQRNKKRIFQQIQRRKKILRGMVITFVLYLVGTAFFEAWLSKKDDQATAVMNQRLSERTKDSLTNAQDVIQNMDSPYDSIFGPGVSTWLSPNQLVVINPISDAVICIVQNDPPHRTIRNEFVHSRNSCIMKDLPNGNYSVKVYIGDIWNDTLRVPDGRVLGRFSMNEQFFRIDREPIILTKPTYDHPQTKTTDTVRIDPNRMNFVQISGGEFFHKGDSLQ